MKGRKLKRNRSGSGGGKGSSKKENKGNVFMNGRKRNREN